MIARPAWASVPRRVDLLCQPVADDAVDPDAELDLRAERFRDARASDLGSQLLELTQLAPEIATRLRAALDQHCA